MSLIAAAAQAVADVPVSVHEWSTSVSITTLLWAIVGLLGGAIVLLGGVVVWYAIGDRSEIKQTLRDLVKVIEDLRVDLAENYAKKLDLADLDRKVEKLREHMTKRSDWERRSVEDAENN